MNRRLVKACILLALLAFGVLFPLLISPNTPTTDIGVYTLVFMFAAIGWNIFSGFTGYISVGHAVYFGVGAYTMALACQDWNIPGGWRPFLILPLTALVAGLFAIPVGWIVLRTRKYAFSITTIAVMYIFQLLGFNLTGITNGSAGLYLPVPPWNPGLLDLPFYYVAFALVLLALFVSWRVRYSKYGLGLLAVRDDEDRAFGLGIKTGGYKLGAYVISAMFVGMAGAMFAYFIGTIFPQFVFDPVVDVNITTIAFLGGLGTLWGPVLGAVLFVPLEQWLTVQFGGSSINLILLGAFLLAVLIGMPRGIIPSLQRAFHARMATRIDDKRGTSVSKPQDRPVLVKREDR